MASKRGLSAMCGRNGCARPSVVPIASTSGRRPIAFPSHMPSRLRHRAYKGSSACPSPVRAQAEADGGGERFRIPTASKSNKLGPSFWLSPEESVQLQLKCLQHNNFPSSDHGIEVLYRFAGLDPFSRSCYFGRPLDLGQFERFRRILYTKPYDPLLNHSEHTIISSLEVSEDVWNGRVLVRNDYRRDEVVYEFKLQRRFGGRWDGVWYVCQLLADGFDDVPLYGLHSDV